VPFYGKDAGFNVPARTVGRRKPDVLQTDKVVKKKLGNPALWAQLDAVSKRRWVNHLGKEHRRIKPYGVDKRIY
jgi:hypothetical protein